jgi:hypothetical protein
MDLGALELQIFVSLVVVLGAAFVALVCDYLKGNNEQLRERNIELRVRTEERERFAILNPSAWLSQFRGRTQSESSAESAARRAPIGTEPMMQSQASAEVLAQAAEREAELLGRTAQEETDLADVPPVAGFDVSARRRARRKLGVESRPVGDAKDNSYDWVRPEVMARVARQAGRGEREVAEGDLGLLGVGGGNGSGEGSELSGVGLPGGMESVPPPEELVGRESRSVEVGAMSPVRPSAPPPVITLRPLPAMKLSEGLERVAAPVSAESLTSQLLDDVIAASAAKPTSVSDTVVAPAIVPAAVVAAAELAAVSEAQAPLAPLRPAERMEGETFGSPMYSASAFAEALSSARKAELADGGGAASEVPLRRVEVRLKAGADQAHMLPSEAAFQPYDPLASSADRAAYDWSNAPYESLPEIKLPSELPELRAELAETPAAAPVNELSELLLPAGMQDIATYRRLLAMPNPMTGIVIAISINDFDRLGGAEGEASVSALLDSVEGLMDSMVRDGDFGVKVSADQWMFVYPIDDKGISQRRVSGLSEKLWDFQLRHLGQSNISFSWAAVNVRDERLSEAASAAMERMEASRQGNQKGGAGRTRLVANG